MRPALTSSTPSTPTPARNAGSGRSGRIPPPARPRTSTGGLRLSTRGHVFEGIGASCDDQKVRGGVVEINQHTGAVQHTWYDAPQGKKGATVWSSQAADGTSVWVTTGSPDETGTAIYDAYSIIRLNESTLAKTGQWTAPNTLTSDLDFGSSPTLFSATLSGVSTPMIGACNKNGNFYALRQSALSAGPVWSRAVGLTGGTGTGACITSAAWDFQLKRLFVASNTLDDRRPAGPGRPACAQSEHRRGPLGAGPSVSSERQPDDQRSSCRRPDVLVPDWRDADRPAVPRVRRAAARFRARDGQDVRPAGVRVGRAVRGQRGRHSHGISALNSRERRRRAADSRVRPPPASVFPSRPP